MGTAKGLIVVSMNLRGVRDAMLLASDSQFHEGIVREKPVVQWWCHAALAETGRPRIHHCAQIVHRAK